MAPTPRQLAAAANAHSQQLAMQQQQQQMAELQRQQQQNRAQNAAAMPLYDPDQLPPLPGKPGLREDTPENQATDVDALMDPVGISGVDIGAEEESMRAANERKQGGAPAQAPRDDRSRRQDFIEPGVLAECVKKIAAAFQLRTLEPDTIPLIALAVRHRLMSLINDAIAARDHRVSAHHLRPPPFVSKKRSRTHDEFDDESDRSEDETNGTELVPAWDHVIFDDQEKLLGVLERVDREEERKHRRTRMIRDQKEEEERELAEAIAASEAAERELNGQPPLNPLLTSLPGTAPSTPGPSKLSKTATPATKDTPGGVAPYGYTASGKIRKEPKPKKKKEGAAMTARTMTEDVRKRLADQTALRSVGGRSFSWMSSGGNGSPGGFGSPSPASSLNKAKFAPASSLPAPNFATPSRPSSGLANSSSLNPYGGRASTLGTNGLMRMSNLPARHDVSRNEFTLNEWEDSKRQVEMGDLVFALERERGMGVGRGSGSRSLTRAWTTRGNGR